MESERSLLVLIVIGVFSTISFALPTGYRCGSELSLILCPNETTNLPNIYNQKLIRGQILDPNSAPCPALSFSANGLTESAGAATNINGENANSVSGAVPYFYLGGPCVSDDDCRPLEGYCLPFPEFPISSSSNAAGFYFSKFLTSAGLPPPTANACVRQITDVGPVSNVDHTGTSSLARGRKWLKILCWAEFVLAVFALTLGSACTGINSGHERTVCTFGTGIWVGLLSLCIAGVGLVAIHVSSAQRKLLIAYFILCVIGALASVILWGVSCMWIDKANKLYYTENQSYALQSITLNVCLLLAAICQTICTFLSAVLLAHYYWGWCCHSSDITSSIAYARAEDVVDSSAEIGGGQQALYAHRSNPHHATPRTVTETNEAANNRFFY